MFSSEHAIWKFADAGDELDDWLPYAEDLVRKWSIQNSDDVSFQNKFDFTLAALLLEDDLLPASARVAFAKVMLEVMDEAIGKKLRFKALNIYPPKPGRKGSRVEILSRFREVKALIQEGASTTVAYKVVAEKYFKSPETIRRDYERLVKKSRKRKTTGENEK